jgi:hypothetical protein
MKENCDKFGNPKDNNVTDKQVKAIKSLKDKMKEENLVCFDTDKTRQMLEATLVKQNVSRET